MKSGTRRGEELQRAEKAFCKKVLDGLDLLNCTEIAESNRGDYRIMLSGVVTHLGRNDFLTENDEIRNRLKGRCSTRLRKNARRKTQRVGLETRELL